MKRIIVIGIMFVLMLTLCAGTVFAQSDSQRQADCSAYARNRVSSEYPAGGGALGGAVRGAAGGAALGAIGGAIGGKAGKGAGIGAAVGGGLGMLGGASRAASQRDANFNYYYNECMSGRR